RRPARHRRGPWRRGADRGAAREPPRAVVGGVPARRAAAPRRALHDPVSAPAPARAAALRALLRVADDEAFADLALDAELTARQLAPRDAALATELVFGTLRWQRYLDWIVGPHSRRPLGTLDTRVLVLLRMTAYQ